MRKAMLLGVLIVLAVSIAVAGAGAATPAPGGLSLPWWVVSGGGEARSAGALQLSATAGQPVLGAGEGGALTLSWGYWAPEEAAPGQRGIYLPLVQR
jgi:hypothetical protein